MQFIDSHCHLDFDVFADDIDQVLITAEKAGVSSFVLPAISRGYWPRLIEFQKKTSQSHIALGLHPYFIEQHTKDDLLKLEQMLRDCAVVAVGECGIDSHCPQLELQQYFFLKHIELANKYKKPLIVHHRQSHHLIFQCFKQIKPLYGGVIHAFSGSLQDAKKYISLGFSLGAGGVLTYQRAKKTRGVFQQIDLNHIVLETDAPDMPLFGKQGQRNEPANLVETAKVLAELRGCELEHIAQSTTHNCHRIFGI